jgi:hypothetical protein
MGTNDQTSDEFEPVVLSIFDILAGQVAMILDGINPSIRDTADSSLMAAIIKASLGFCKNWAVTDTYTVDDVEYEFYSILESRLYNDANRFAVDRRDGELADIDPEVYGLALQNVANAVSRICVEAKHAAGTLKAAGEFDWGIDGWEQVGKDVFNECVGKPRE